MGVIMKYGSGLLGVTSSCTLLAPMLLHLVEITHTYTHTCVHPYVHTCICTNIHTAYPHTYNVICTYTHTNIHPFIHPPTYIYTYLLSTKYQILCLQRQVWCHVQQQGTPERQVTTLATVRGDNSHTTALPPTETTQPVYMDNKWI